MNELQRWMIKVLLILPVLLLSLFIHEMSHITVALLMGRQIIRFEFVPIGWNLMIEYHSVADGWPILMAGGLVQTIFLLWLSRVYVKNLRYVSILTFMYMIFETFMLFDFALLVFPTECLAFAIAVALDGINITDNDRVYLTGIE